MVDPGKRELSEEAEKGSGSGYEVETQHRGTKDHKASLPVFFDFLDVIVCEECHSSAVSVVGLTARQHHIH